jgi:hypothetical protein
LIISGCGHDLGAARSAVRVAPGAEEFAVVHAGVVVRVGTWNLENFFRVGEGSRGPRTAQEYQAKLDALATTITELAPEVLAVQEVGSPAALGQPGGPAGRGVAFRAGRPGRARPADRCTIVRTRRVGRDRRVGESQRQAVVEGAPGPVRGGEEVRRRRAAPAV